MTPTKTIPIARNAESLQLEAAEAQMARMAELQDHLFYNRLVTGMRERQAQSTSLPKNKLEDERRTSFMENIPSTVPVSILMSPSRTRRFNSHESSQSPSSMANANSPSNRVLSSSSSSSSPPLATIPYPTNGRFERAELSTVLTQSLQILEDDAEGDELMFEMDF